MRNTPVRPGRKGCCHGEVKGSSAKPKAEDAQRQPSQVFVFCLFLVNIQYKMYNICNCENSLKYLFFNKKNAKNFYNYKAPVVVPVTTTRRV